MPVSDHLVKIMSKCGKVRALACTTTELVNELTRRHDTWPTASAALARALTGGALFGSMLKTGQRVALKFEGNGPLKKILIEADSNGAVRGCVGFPHVHLPEKNGKLDVAGALGRAGFLTVSKDLGLKEPYRGTVQLFSSEIAEDLALYLTESEQIPSAVGLGVYVETDNTIAAAGGFLIQALPPSDNALVDTLMERIEQLPPISDLLRMGDTPEQLLAKLFADIPYDILEKKALAFNCTCSREKIEKVLLSFGRVELADMLEKQGEITVDCEFCREHFIFDRQAIELLLEELSVA